MIKGTEKKYDMHAWEEPVSKVPASITCFPTNFKPLKFAKRVIKLAKETEGVIRNFKPILEDGKVARDCGKGYNTLITKEDHRLIDLIIAHDADILKIRYYEERCMNCGHERSPWSTFICGRCRMIRSRVVKRELKDFAWGLMKDYPITNEQRKNNDKRRARA